VKRLIQVSAEEKISSMSGKDYRLPRVVANALL
jgi:hypothetical protein